MKKPDEIQFTHDGDAATLTLTSGDKVCVLAGQFVDVQQSTALDQDGVPIVQLEFKNFAVREINFA